jgi:2-oxo-4-hydroxy-4-carboxy-5-ureidoimidazoline decarboxylase
MLWAQPVPLDSVNGLSPAEFVTLLGEVFERAPWVAEAVAPLHPFATVTGLHDAMLAAVVAAPDEAFTQLLNRHPDLAGPAAPKEPLTADSAREQAGAGLNRLSPQETARLAALNARYRARFGFPFIICARRHTKDSIFAEFERRLANDIAEERRAALAEIARITALRLAARVSGPGMPKVHGELTTHLLDVAQGRPAAGVPIELYVLSAQGPADLVATAISNEDGRTSAPLIAGRPIPNGTYELRFSLGAYFSGQTGSAFLEVVPVRFTTAEPEGRYHIPLLFTPWGYSTYRGS